MSKAENVANYFNKYRYDVFIIDYRGFGKSVGLTSEKAFYEDAELGYKELIKNYSEKQVILFVSIR